MAMENSVKTEKLSVGYGERKIVEEISLSIQAGEILVLIGPNGVGKSTVLKSLTGELQKQGGQIWIDREEIEAIRREELGKRMAVMYTEKLRTEWESCEEVVASGRYPYTGRFGLLQEADRRAIHGAMTATHTEQLRDQPFSGISDGQRQRVMLARALAQEAGILVLDEPTSYLDIRYKLEFLKLLKERSRERGITILLSLHELELVKLIADRVVTVKDGRVHRVGSPAEILTVTYVKELYEISGKEFDSFLAGMLSFRP